MEASILIINCCITFYCECTVSCFSAVLGYSLITVAVIEEAVMSMHSRIPYITPRLVWLDRLHVQDTPTNSRLHLQYMYMYTLNAA